MSPEPQEATAGVEALAQTLAGIAGDPDGWEEWLPDASSIVADPTALLAALARAGVLTIDDHVEWCRESCGVWSHYKGATCTEVCRQLGDHEGDHECQDGHSFARHSSETPAVREFRYLSGWRKVKP